jgi:hypothetical protein
MFWVGRQVSGESASGEWLMIRVLEAFPNSSMTSRRGAKAQRRKKESRRASYFRYLCASAPLREHFYCPSQWLFEIAS